MWTLTVVSILIAAAGLVFTIRREVTTARRQEIWFHLNVQRLAPLSAPELAPRVTVNVDDVPVHDPHLVELRFWVSSPRDLRSTDFEGGQNLSFQLGAPLHGVVQPPRVFELEDDAVDWSSDGEVSVQPGLLRVGSGAEISFISAGQPQFSVRRNPIADTQVRDFALEASRTFADQLKRAFWGLGAFTGGLVVLVGTLVVLTAVHASGATVWTYVTPVLVIVAGGLAGWIIPLSTPSNIGLASRRAPDGFDVDFVATWKSRLRTDPLV